MVIRSISPKDYHNWSEGTLDCIEYNENFAVVDNVTNKQFYADRLAQNTDEYNDVMNVVESFREAGS
jgi:aminoglycoside phosphotransferase family enzyme